jgi:HK97 gp10 family phage protein
MVSVASQLEGVRETYAQIRALGEVQETRVLRSAVREAGKPILREMVSRAPVGALMHRTYKGRFVAPGFLRRSLRMVVTRIKKTGSIAAIFGARKEAFYGPQFVERGTVKQRAQEFMVAAIESQQEQALQRFADTMRKRLASIAKRASK